MVMKFYDVFTELKLPQRLEDMFETVRVDKLTTNSAKTYLHIFLSCDYLISKEDIWYVEKEIKKQKLEDTSIIVKIYESFYLSESFTPESFFDAYKDSILSEMKEQANLVYSMFKRANCEFSEVRHLNIELEDNIVAHERVDKLEEILIDVFKVRAHLDVDISFTFRKASFDKYKKEDEHKISMMVQDITQKAFSEEKDNSGDSEYAVLEEEKQEVKNAPAEIVKTSVGEKPKSENRYKEEKRKQYKKSDDPDVIFGRDVVEETIPISTIIGEVGEVVIHGKIIASEGRETQSGKYLYSFDITDFTDTISVKMFLAQEQAPEVLPELGKGKFVKVKGIAKHDTYVREVTVSSVAGIRKIKDFTSTRADNSLSKRVELHCHTKMSDSDGVSYAKDLIARAKSWGMKALAITDHGVVQAFPEAVHSLSKDDDFKVLYGVEAYLVDDYKRTVVNCKEGQSLRGTFVVFDLETTGFSAVNSGITEIGAVKVINGEITDRFSTFVDPKRPIQFRIEKLTGISDSMVHGAPTIEEALPKFLEFCEGAVLVAHNASFDVGFINENMRKLDLFREFTSVDTLAVSRTLLTDIGKHTLDSVAKKLKIDMKNHHRAVDDAETTAWIFKKFITMLEDKDVTTLEELNYLTESSIEAVRKLPFYHAIIIAKNEIGRVNLYRLVSESHLKYFHGHPKLPKSVISKYREGLILGSACEAGELYRALVEEAPDDKISEIVNFYDYLEIQPLGNNKFMLNSDKYSNINTEEDLKNINRRIVKLGEEFSKPVVATCDVHFMDPEDEVYRRIIMAGKGFTDADDQAPLYLRTTEEMLNEFDYLGSEKAEEIVITNTNLIADWCDYVNPIHPDKCPPVIEKSDETLRKICDDRAHELYGEVLPDIVSKRLEKELHSIITNGFAVMYIIAQKLVWKSNEDGYLVGSRGSVGSSFVATMAGITEVNPLPPHYYCTECYYSDFDSDEVKTYAGRAGCDMPDKDCPVCGHRMHKDGFDIPFETFLGFKGDKEPDIDLNFSGEYQSKAHKYTEVIFGAGQTFRAGTIGTLADKTAFGYVKKYYEERGTTKRSCEINRVVQGCIDVRRTTGQHPGGIIVLPLGYDINQFTPVQHPANDMTTDIITTHFDYHSIDHNLLKLDILGHDDPTMIRMLQDLTGIDPTKIPLDDPQVMSLFKSTDALGITPSQIDGVELGSLGIPEFGTDFVIQMLKDTKPESFSDLVRISGLSHGTDVWLGNAQTLIEEGKATISTAICTRDDIMTYLIHMGVESSLSFTIMEAVRKGKGLKPEWEEAMKEKDVPDWYIWSCKKIKYMFPKAHAAAYVMMAWRIAYCKVNYPLAYYAAYFTIRASAFSYDYMCHGKEHLERVMNEYKNNSNLTQKEEDTLKDMKIVQEMYARGFEFHKLDIYTAHQKHFQIIDGKIMPPLTSIEGLAEKAAEGIVEAIKNGPFFSKDDFRERTKVTKSVVESLSEMGLLGDLPESNQLSIFDFT